MSSKKFWSVITRMPHGFLKDDLKILRLSEDIVPSFSRILITHSSDSNFRWALASSHGKSHDIWFPHDPPPPISYVYPPAYTKSCAWTYRTVCGLKRKTEGSRERYQAIVMKKVFKLRMPGGHRKKWESLFFLVHVSRENGYDANLWPKGDAGEHSAFHLHRWCPGITVW